MQVLQELPRMLQALSSEIKIPLTNLSLYHQLVAHFQSLSISQLSLRPLNLMILSQLSWLDQFFNNKSSKCSSNGSMLTRSHAHLNLEIWSINSTHNLLSQFTWDAMPQTHMKRFYKVSSKLASSIRSCHTVKEPTAHQTLLSFSEVLFHWTQRLQ